MNKHLCMISNGIWTLKPSSNCATFEEEEYYIDTSGEVNLDFKPKTVKVSGLIHHEKEDNVQISKIKVRVGGERATLKRKSETRI